MRNFDDKELAAAALNGDRDAYSELVLRHQDTVYNLAYRMCGNSATAEDLAQEAFIRAYKKLVQFKPEFPFRNWVLGICANLCRSRYRWWRRRREIQDAYVAEQLVLDSGERGDGNHHGDDLKVSLDLALAALPHTLRMPIVLRYMENMSVEMVAKTLNIGLSAAKMRLVRGREQLARILQHQSESGGSQ